MTPLAQLSVYKSDEGELLVHDPAAQEQRSEYLSLWNASTSKLDRYRASVFGSWAERVDGSAAEGAKSAYSTWAEAERRKDHDNLLNVHARFLAGRDLPNAGIRAAVPGRDRRVTHCFACKDPLDNQVDAACIACGWIVCAACGACGCGFEKHH